MSMKEGVSESQTDELPSREGQSMQQWQRGGIAFQSYIDFLIVVINDDMTDDVSEDGEEEEQVGEAETE